MVDSSRLLALDLSYRVSSRLRLGASVQQRSTAYLDELPLLYSRFTSDRFASDTLSFGLGASLVVLTAGGLPRARRRRSRQEGRRSFTVSRSSSSSFSLALIFLPIGPEISSPCTIS